MNNAFHQVLKELFCWTETKRLLDEMSYPIQRFLVVLCLRRDGNEFINVREVTPWISKLLYGIRVTVWTELMKRNETEQLDMDDQLDELKVYLRKQSQTPFSFLYETKHLAFSIAGETSALPQVTWLGKQDYQALAIHGKKVELSQLKSLYKTLLKKARRQLNTEVKMGLPGLSI